MNICVVIRFYCQNELVQGRKLVELVLDKSEEAALLNLPSTHNADDHTLKGIIPNDLYIKLYCRIYRIVEDFVYLELYYRGLYNLNVNHWYIKDVKSGCLSNINKELIVNDFFYEDEELFETWLMYESLQVKEKGIDYLRTRYGKEMKLQTDMSQVKWHIEF